MRAIDRDKSGAGLGLAILVTLCGSLLINWSVHVEPTFEPARAVTMRLKPEQPARAAGAG